MPWRSSIEMEHIRLFWEDALGGEPPVILYEVNTGHEWLAFHSIDIFVGGHTHNIPDLYDEAIEIIPVPTVEEFNVHVWGEEFHVYSIEKTESGAVWESYAHNGALRRSEEI